MKLNLRFRELGDLLMQLIKLIEYVIYLPPLIIDWTAEVIDNIIDKEPLADL